MVCFRKIFQRAALATICSILFSNSAAADDAWRQWLHELNKVCPSQHVDWVADGGYDDLLQGFDQNLSAKLRRRVNHDADSVALCAGVNGFSCEMGAYLDAYQELNLMKRFVEFDCRNWRCEDYAMCTTRVHLPPLKMVVTH